MDGTCHCGAVRVSVPSAPTEVTDCNCSICRRYGTLWAYYKVGQVTISGPTATYSWGPKHLAFHRCEACGCVVVWMGTQAEITYCGINARLLDGLDLATVTHVFEDNASA